MILTLILMGTLSTAHPVLLGTRAIEIKSTPLDAKWESIMQEMRTVGYDKGYNGDIRSINTRVNQSIEYVEDGPKGDHWAKPSETLSKKKGDCEDIAFLKMYYLLKSGYKIDDIYFVVVFDKITRRDHSVLIVREQGEYMVLDSKTNRILDGSLSHEYQPRLTFNVKKKYVHSGLLGKD